MATSRTISPVARERPFGLGELFFSTTDRKGIIRTSNDVFARVSGYPVDQLVGRPHNLIRHPDMPRAVFQLLWDYIAAGRPFAGYVKNMAADGAYYWVMALVVPIDHGYLSVRLKPSSPLLPVVNDLYREMRAIEQPHGAAREGIAASAAHLTRALAGRGFPSYDEFMRSAMATEFASRRTTLGARGEGASRGALRRQGASPALVVVASQDSATARSLAAQACLLVDAQLDDLFARLEAFLGAIDTIEAKIAFLRDLARTIHLVALNAVIASCRLDSNAAALSTVTQDLARMTGQASDTIARMTDELVALTSSLRQTAFAATAAKLQVEMTLAFIREAGAPTAAYQGADLDATDRSADTAMLVDALGRSVDTLIASLPSAKAHLRPIARSQDDLAADLRRLASVHVIGKVQSAGVADAVYFTDVLETIAQHLAQARAEIDELGDGVAVLADNLPAYECAGVEVRRLLDEFTTLVGADGSSTGHALSV